MLTRDVQERDLGALGVTADERDADGLAGVGGGDSPDDLVGLAGGDDLTRLGLGDGIEVGGLGEDRGGQGQDGGKGETHLEVKLKVGS